MCNRGLSQQDADEEYKTVKQGAEFFVTNRNAAERATAYECLHG